MDTVTRRAAFSYVVFVAVAIAVGVRVLQPLGVGLDASPFVGRWDLRLGAGVLVPAAVAVAVVAWGPTLAARLPWRWVPPLTGVVGVAWAVALALTDGWAKLTAPLTTRFEYEPFAATIDSAPHFVRTFTERGSTFPVHVKGHPPGATLVPWALDRVGLSGAGWFAVVAIAGWGVALAAVLVAVRRVAGEPAARRAAPALALLPGAIWAATSADALFAGVFAVGVAVAVGGGRRQAAIGGAILGLGCFLTYGGVLLGLVPAVVHLRERRYGHLALVAGGAASVVVAVWAATGFWWFDGLAVTREAYWFGVASRRPALYLTALGNPAALAVAVGPATVVGLAAVTAARRWSVAVLPLAALAAVTLADLSQLSKGEVERIWLPFAVWIGAGAVGDRRGWLAAQAGAGLLVQVALVSTW